MFFFSYKEWSIPEDWLPVRCPFGEDNDKNYVLELGDGKDGKILQGCHWILVLGAHVPSPVPEVYSEGVV